MKFRPTNQPSHTRANREVTLSIIMNDLLYNIVLSLNLACTKKNLMPKVMWRSSKAPATPCTRNTVGAGQSGGTYLQKKYAPIERKNISFILEVYILCYILISSIFLGRPVHLAASAIGGWGGRALLCVPTVTRRFFLF